MKVFRVYLGHGINGGGLVGQRETENFIADTVDPLFDGFTVIPATGRWKGKAEPVTIVEIVADESQRPQIDYIAAEYTRRFHQDAVLVTSQDTTFDLVESRAVAA